MKRCPECRRDYYDDSLLYCLDDGTALLEGPASGAESATAILHDTASPSVAPTRAQIHTTEKTALYPSGDVHVAKSSGLNRRIVLGLLALSAVALAGFFAYRYFYTGNSGTIDSIAVLPFENRSESADAEYLSDGLAESLIYRLSQLPDLKVSPTSAVMRYKGKDRNLADIAHELGVRAVMTGKLVQRGDNLTVSIELIDVSNNKLLWGEQYDRKMADLLATQREIASTIAEKLQLKLVGDEKGIAKKYTQSNEAYQHYLKGRFYWNKRTAENVTKAIEQFQQAADRDPTFALAYVGLADSYLIAEQYSTTPSSETVPRARAAAARALEIDESLAEAHASMGMVNQEQWQPDEAEKEYKRAIELNPNYATARQWYSILLTIRGRHDEAMAEIQRGQQADPLSPIISINVGLQYILRGELDSAAAQFEKALEVDPNFALAMTDLGHVFTKKGREQEAIAYFEKAAKITGRSNEALGSLGYGYAVLGKRAEAIAILNELESKHARRETPAMYIAGIHGALGDKNSAFEWLEKDYQARTALMPYIAMLPAYDTLRDDPRFADLLRRTGFR